MTPTKPSVRLVVHGLGAVPAFKNKKRAILDKRTGKLRTLTPKKTKQWMEAAIESFVSQLWSECQTNADGTWTEPSPHSSMCLSLPADDSMNDIAEITLRSETVSKGQEGASIEITPL